ncbi:unnamed protein product, partial [Rotaria sp. Silwood2]
AVAEDVPNVNPVDAATGGASDDVPNVNVVDAVGGETNPNGVAEV